MDKENNIPGKNNFDMPEGYFDSFNGRLFARIELEEELKEFPAITAIRKELPFLAPENYFESITQKVTARIEKEAGKSAKVVSLGSFLSAYKYAVAAVLVLLIGTGAFFRLYKNTEVTGPDKVCMELACLTKEEITSSSYFNQISLSELETVAGQEVQDSLNAEINGDLVNELLQNPEELSLIEDELEL